VAKWANGVTSTTDYDRIATGYDRRYQEQRYEGCAAALQSFVARGQRVLEVGCGTGHWLAQLEAWGCDAVGVEPSTGMLARARARLLQADLVRGQAEALPFETASFDRVLCINAVHHFADVTRFCCEARRVLRPGGRVLSIALDPSGGRDSWYIYEYFTRTLALDRARYPAASALRAELEAAGFVASETLVAEHLKGALSARDVLDHERLTPSATSQLAIISEAELQAGIARIRADLMAAEARGQDLPLRYDLILYATTANVPG